MKHAKHGSHPQILKRLKRAHGHLASVIAMLEEDRSCLDLAQQLHAVECAIGTAKQVLIRDHIDHCLVDVTQRKGRGANKTLAEFKALAKYL